MSDPTLLNVHIYHHLKGTIEVQALIFIIIIIIIIIVW